MAVISNATFIDKLDIRVMKTHVNITQPDDTKPLPQAILTKISDAIWRHQATMSRLLIILYASDGSVEIVTSDLRINSSRVFTHLK